ARLVRAPRGRRAAARAVVARAGADRGRAPLRRLGRPARDGVGRRAHPRGPRGLRRLRGGRSRPAGTAAEEVAALYAASGGVAPSPGFASIVAGSTPISIFFGFGCSGFGTWSSRTPSA